jgi:hypothetical protein
VSFDLSLIVRNLLCDNQVVPRGLGSAAKSSKEHTLYLNKHWRKLNARRVRRELTLLRQFMVSFRPVESVGDSGKSV